MAFITKLDEVFHNPHPYPCKHCTKRSPGCHDRCPEYNAVKADNHAIHEAFTSEKSIHSALIEIGMEGERLKKNRDRRR